LVAALAALAALAACGDPPTARDQRETAPPSRPSLAIHDARGGGAAGFYFRPPIQPALASYPSGFDPTRSPSVEICRWADRCVYPLVASYTRTSGTGGATIQVDAANQLYRVDWPTAGLSPADVYRIRVLDEDAVLGWADAKVVGPGETAAALTAQGIVPLGNASRLPIRFRLEYPPGLELRFEERSVSFATTEVPRPVRLSLRSQGAPTPAPAGGLRVALAVSGPIGYPTACVSAPPLVTIPAGQTGVTVNLGAGDAVGAFDGACGGAVTASAPDDPTVDSDRITAVVWVGDAVTLALTPYPGSERVGAGLMVPAQFTASPRLPPRSVVTITSANPGRLLLSLGQHTPGTASVTLTTASAQVWVHAIEGQTGVASVNVTATLPSPPNFKPVQTSASFEVVQPRIAGYGDVLGLVCFPDPGSFPIIAQIGIPMSDGSVWGQWVRAGRAFPVTFTSSNPTVGQLRSGSLTAASVTVTIPGGDLSTPTDAGLVEFIPLALGATTVTITAPGASSGNWTTLGATVADCSGARVPIGSARAGRR
jgi:hypothetical protein